jgi:hypothetical protein
MNIMHIVTDVKEASAPAAGQHKCGAFIIALLVAYCIWCITCG